VLGVMTALTVTSWALRPATRRVLTSAGHPAKLAQNDCFAERTDVAAFVRYLVLHGTRRCS
jgi:hypothetical protein